MATKRFTLVQRGGNPSAATDDSWNHEAEEKKPRTREQDDDETEGYSEGNEREAYLGWMIQ